MAQIGSVEIAVQPDFKGFKSKVDSYLRALKDAEIKIDPNMGGFKQKVDQFTRGMEANVSVDADTRIARARIAELTRNNRATITIDVDESKLSQIGKIFGGGSGGGGGALGGIGLAGGGLRTVGLVAGAIALLGPALSGVSTVLAALPALIMGVAAPAGVVALAVTDLEKAFEDITGKALEFKQPLLDLQKAVQGGFMAGFQPGALSGNGELGDMFDGVANLKLLLQQLQPVMSLISEGMGALANSFLQTLTAVDETTGISKLQGILTNIGTTLGSEDMWSGVRGITNAFLDLAGVVTGQGMADAFRQLGVAMSTWTADPANMQLVKDALSGLLGVATSLGPVISNLLEQGIKQMADPKFVENITSMVSGLGNVVVAVAGIGNALAFMGNFLGPVFTFLGEAIGNLKYPIETIGNAFGWLVSKLGEAALFIHTAWSNVGTIFSGVVSVITGAMGQIWSAVVDAWTNIVAACVGGVTQAVAAISGFGSSAVATVTGFVGAMVDAGTQLIMGLVRGLGNAVGAAVAKAREVASQVAGAVKGFFGIESPSKLMAEYGGFIVEGLANGIQDQKSAAVSSITDVMDEMGKAVDDAIKEQQKAMQDAGTEFGKGLFAMPFDFADTFGKQAMSDIGISGGGALGAVMDTGVGWLQDSATNFVFNVNNMDDAIAGQRAQQSKQAAGVVSR